MKANELADILNSNGIPTRTEGENVQPGWVGIDCPACGDKNKHMGIDPDRLIASCWRCNEKGHLSYILGRYFGVKPDELTSYLSPTPDLLEKDALSRVLDITRPLTRNSDETTQSGSVAVKLEGLRPTVCTVKRFQYLKAFLRDRNLELKDLQKYDCRFQPVGFLAKRILIPVKDNRRVIGYVSRTCVNASPKYWTKGDVKSYLYDPFVDWTKPVFLVEGCFDKWRVGDQGAAVLSRRITDIQIDLISRKAKAPVVICFDGDSLAENMKAANDLRFNGIDCDWLKLPSDHDPDSIGRSAFRELVETKFGYGKYVEERC